MAQTWNLDLAHSELLFSVRHLMISNVKGQFVDFNATITAAADGFENATVQATIASGSVNTKSADRDTHLKSADFFDAEQFPEISFTGTKFSPAGEGNYELQGDLTIKGITQPITLNVEYGGTVKDPWGNEKAGFSFSGKLNRKDFGLNWNAALETGGVMVSDEVKLSGEVQFAKQA